LHSVATSPAAEVLREHWKAVLIAAGVVAVIGGFNGMLYGFLPAYLVQTLHYSPSQTALAMTTALLVSSAGLICGRMGRRLSATSPDFAGRGRATARDDPSDLVADRRGQRALGPAVGRFVADLLHH
jgi:MFS family permease